MACADVDMDIHGDDYDWTEAQEGDWTEAQEDDWNEPRKGDRIELHRRDGRDTDNGQESRGGDGKEAPVIQHYQALEFMPDEKGPLHDLLQKQPAVLGSLQIMSGFLSIGVGVIFSITQNMGQSLITLFRASQLTGVLFIIAGFVSNLLFKYPALLPVSLAVNYGCIVVAVFAVCMITVDLSRWEAEHEQHLRVEMLELCVLVHEVVLSAILCFWFSKEKRAQSA